jgi:hypothetical protein
VDARILASHTFTFADTMKWTRKKKIAASISGVYCALWLITATWGEWSVDHRFDRDFARADTGVFGPSGKTVPITRLRGVSASQMMDPEFALETNEVFPFRYRSRGIPVAPLVVVDRAATVYSSLGGFAGWRVSFWCFGYTRWWLVKPYWMV